MREKYELSLLHSVSILRKYFIPFIYLRILRRYQMDRIQRKFNFPLSNSILFSNDSKSAQKFNI